MHSKIHACLLGGAIGDALGATIEFLSLDEIDEAYPDGFKDLPTDEVGLAAFTDDTQMTLFGIEALREALPTKEDRITSLQKAYGRWYLTQYRDDAPQGATGLLSDIRMNRTKAPGMTCLGALRDMKPDQLRALNQSKGCRTIMRTAPFAFVGNKADIHDLAMAAAYLTHGHDTGAYAAAFWSELLRKVAEGEDLEEASLDLLNRYRSYPQANEVNEKVAEALMVPRTGEAKVLASLGEGWIAEETLAIALYACLAGKNLEQALDISVRHSGDSDSTGAVAGNLLGLLYPEHVFEHRWAKQLDAADIIEAGAMQLFEVYNEAQ